MGEVKCIACSKVNGAGDRFCAGCGSSLDLRLCTACEAINNPVAESCHSCGKPLLAQAVATSPVEVAEASESPFYPPRRWETYDARPSLASRLGHAAKLVLFVILPLAAIAVWAHQFYGERLLRVIAAPAQTPAAAAVTPSLAEPVVQAAPAAVETKPRVVETKQQVAQPKPPAIQTKQPVARTVTHTGATATAPVVPVAPVVEDKTTPMTRGRVTHTRASALAPAATVVPVAAQPVTAPPPAAASTAASGCPEAVAVLGLCTSNSKGKGK